MRWGVDGVAFRTTAGQVFLARGCEVACADLSIAEAADVIPTIAGSNVTYLVTVKNSSEGVATGVRVTDTMPAGLEFVSASADCSQSGSVVVCNLGVLLGGVSTTFTIVAEATTTGVISNSVSVDGDLFDPYLSNNSRLAPTADAATYGLFKAQLFAQMSQAKPKKLPDFAGYFFAFLDVGIKDSIGNVTLGLPDASQRGLSIDPTGLELGFADLFDSKRMLDKAYQSGEYTIAFSGLNNFSKSLTLNLAAAHVPKPPHISNWGAAQLIRAGTDFILTWDALTWGMKEDAVIFSVFGGNSELIFSGPGRGEPGELNGTSSSVLIPQTTLLPGQTYTALLGFANNPTIDDTSYPGALGSAAYFGITQCELRTLDSQTPGAGAFAFSAPRYTVNENGGSVTITVVRTGGNSDPVAVDFVTGGGNAVAGVAYEVVERTLRFGNGETSKAVTIPILEDGVTRSRSKFGIELRNPTTGAQLGVPSRAVVTIFK